MILDSACAVGRPGPGGYGRVARAADYAILSCIPEFLVDKGLELCARGNTLRALVLYCSPLGGVRGRIWNCMSALSVGLE